jgi:uncharacterized membrane protein
MMPGKRIHQMIHEAFGNLARNKMEADRNKVNRTTGWHIVLVDRLPLRLPRAHSYHVNSLAPG